MHDLQTLKDINEQEAATRALNAIRKSAELGKANRMKRIKENGCKSGRCGGYSAMSPEEVAELVKKFHAAKPE